VSLATFKFLKVFIHTASFYLLTNPAQQPVNPTLSPNNVTVIVPSIGEFDGEFIECIETMIANRPREIIVSTVGQDKFNRASAIAQELNSLHPDAKIRVLSNLTPNKRSQFMSGLLEAKTEITAYADDHVFWPPTFLRSSLAPFEDHHVGLVGTVKKVRRDRSGGFWKSFMNYIACLYLERHNFECTASYNLDGGVFVISGRTALTRTEIMHDVDFRKEFLGETWWWGEVGPLKVDDDNCVTRWMVKHGWKTVFHNSPDAVVETSLGTTGGLEKFRGQLIRWVRTTWRSNATSLFAECDCWSVHPWTTYAMFISSFFNIALVYDPLLILTLYRSGYQDHIYSLLLALLISKLIKPIEHVRKEPRDIFVMLPMGLLFGYVHSIFKIWAFFTAGNIEWTGRKGLS
jgi:cellulose synthase/poly-beta-1,6-N-acetylglucosamine synthase-like glycosyltransferase